MFFNGEDSLRSTYRMFWFTASNQLVWHLWTDLLLWTALKLVFVEVFFISTKQENYIKEIQECKKIKNELYWMGIITRLIIIFPVDENGMQRGVRTIYDYSIQPFSLFRLFQQNSSIFQTWFWGSSLFWTKSRIILRYIPQNGYAMTGYTSLNSINYL